jgi:mannosyltransferase OCH1-like enzyme
MTNNKIPKIIYQSWKTKDIKGKMLDAVNTVKNLNPDYEYKFYDDEDCRKFLLDNFGKPYLIAFDSLIPGAFKCDLWRYAVLYMYGGVYMDIDMIPLVSFNEIIDDEDEFVSVVDRPRGAIYQAFVACVPRHPIILHCLELSFYNIMSKRQNKKTSDIFLSYTGPIVAGQAFHIYMNNKDTYSEIYPKKYNKINLDYIFRGDDVMRKSTNKIVFNNKYENYKSINNYSVNKPYKNISDKNKIFFIKVVKVFLCLTILILISFVIYRGKYIKCNFNSCK